MRKLVNFVLLASVLGSLAGASIVGTAGAHTGHVVTIGDVAVTEGNGNNVGTATVTVHVDPAPQLGEQVLVDFGTSAHGATAKTTVSGDSTPEFPEDFAQTAGTVTFLATQTDQTLAIPVLQDNADEANETFFVNLFNARGECLVPGTCDTDASIDDARATVTINDDDATPTLSISDVTHDEGDAGTTAYDFAVTKTGGNSEAVSVDYATANGSAVAPGDYAAKSGALTFAPSSPDGSSPVTHTVNVAVNGDTTFESSETFTVNLSDALNATIADVDGSGTVSNDDAPPPPAMVVGDATGNEGDTLAFSVDLSSPPAPGQTAMVDWALVGTTGEGKATEGTDYTAATGSHVFTAGETEQTVSVPTAEDAINEADETFSLKLTKPASHGTGGYTYNIETDTGVGTITNDDAAPTLSIDDVTLDPEAGTGDTNVATFTVTKSGLTDQAVGVHFATADGTATEGADYTAETGELSFATDEVSKEIAVEVKGDELDEADESFGVTLSEVTGRASIVDGEGTGTIKDDDAESVAFSIADVKVTEGNSGTLTANLAVSKSVATGRTTTVKYATANATANSGSDYDATSGTLSFGPDEASKNVAVVVRADVLDENNEWFVVNLSEPTNASIADGQAAGVITDDDATPTMSIGNGNVSESSSAVCTLTVTLSAPSGRKMTVHYATHNGAAGTSDYVTKSGDLTFVWRDQSEQIKIFARSDTRVEGTERFYVKLSGISPSGAATFSDSTGMCRIIDND